MGQELKKRANQLYRHNLTGLLEGALRSSNAQYEPAFILDRIGIRLLEAQPGDTGWEVFSLDYAVDFPLSAIVHANALTKYHAMFHMLWRLKRVEWVLADSYEQLMEFKRRQGLLVLPKLLPVIHKCTMYRSSMLHVVNNLSAFLMFEVLETSWLKLQDGIRNCANNLDDLISLHDSYLDEILTKSMLTPAYEMLNMQIQQVIQTVLRFCGLEEALLFDANTSMQRKRSQKMDMESSSISAGTWGVIDESVLDNPAGTVEGVPSYVITRLDDAYDDFCEQLTTLMSMLNEQGGEIGEILRFLTFRLDYNNYMSNMKTSQTVPGTGATGMSDPSVSFMSSVGSLSTPAPAANLGERLNAAAMNKVYGTK
jgi:gamma-tubulin complex component 3